MVDRIPMRDMARQVPAQAVGWPRHDARVPIPVRAWIIDSTGRDVLIEGKALAWTSTAVSVCYYDHNGREGRVWVWASAVTRWKPT